MTTTTGPTLTWSRLDAAPDPVHGVPCARSSHGVSIVHHADTNEDCIVLYGGEQEARTPVPNDNCGWMCRRRRSGMDTHQTTQAWQWQWFDCSAVPSRIGHAQAAYHNQHVYVFGGRAGVDLAEATRNDLWVLDTTTLTWSEVVFDAAHKEGTIPTPRSFHRMVSHPATDSLYVFGGCKAGPGRYNDLWRLHVPTRTWTPCGTSAHLAGRGGAGLLPLSDGIAVVAGFCGHETADGHVYEIREKHSNNDKESPPGVWATDALTPHLSGLRPRSVCATAALPQANVCVMFGGEVDPSERGHAGAGGFAKDVVVLDGTTARLRVTVEAPTDDSVVWPEERGWSDAASQGNSMFLFGGLSGNDECPKRLDDLWQLDVVV